MNLQENIHRIKEVMGLITESEEQEVFPSKSFAYHVTPDIYIESIKMNGLTPKSESKLENHPERIYLYLDPESSYKTLTSDLWHLSKHKDKIKNYYVLEIDLTKIPEHKFYNDPQSYFGYVGIYTKQPIPTFAIKVVETIPIQGLPTSTIMDDKSDDEEVKKMIQNFGGDSEENNFWDELIKKMDVDEASVYDFNDPSEKVAKYKKKREYNDLKKDDVTNQFIKKIGKFEFYYSINEEEGEFLISVVDSIKKVMVAKAPFVMKFSDMDFEASAPYVDPEYRNIGVGTQIYKTALDFGNVVSGINKSQYAVGLWKKMYRELTNKMVAVDPETKKEYPVTMDENGDLKVDGNDNIKIYGDESRVYLKLYQN